MRLRRVFPLMSGWMGGAKMVTFDRKKKGRRGNGLCVRSDSALYVLNMEQFFRRLVD